MKDQEIKDENKRDQTENTTELRPTLTIVQQLPTARPAYVSRRPGLSSCMYAANDSSRNAQHDSLS